MCSGFVVFAEIENDGEHRLLRRRFIGWVQQVLQRKMAQLLFDTCAVGLDEIIVEDRGSQQMEFGIRQFVLFQDVFQVEIREPFIGFTLPFAGLRSRKGRIL